MMNFYQSLVARICLSLEVYIFLEKHHLFAKTCPLGRQERKNLQKPDKTALAGQSNAVIWPPCLWSEIIGSSRPVKAATFLLQSIKAGGWIRWGYASSRPSRINLHGGSKIGDGGKFDRLFQLPFKLHLKVQEEYFLYTRVYAAFSCWTLLHGGPATVLHLEAFSFKTTN